MIHHEQHPFVAEIRLSPPKVAIRIILGILVSVKANQSLCSPDILMDHPSGPTGLTSNPSHG